MAEQDALTDVPASIPQPSSRRRIVLAGTAGIFVEAFDWTLYGLVAPYLAGQVFPGDRAAKVLGAYLVFASGFLARPIGSALMGRITDTRGRRTGLSLSVLLMAAGSLVLVVTPTYAQAGWAAVAVVFLARTLQGVAMGGEIATAATFVVEVAPRRLRHTYGAIAYSGDALGGVGAAAVLAALFAVLGDAGVRGGGWRLAFGVGALLGLIGWWIRRGVEESEVFRAAAAREHPPTGELLRVNAARMVLVFAMTIGSTVGVYFATVYLPQFAAHTGHITQSAATSQLTIALLVLLASMITAGVLADRFGPLALIRVGFTVLAVTTAPLMAGLISGTVPFLVAASVFCGALGLQLGVTPVAGARLFPVRVRALALGVPAALAIAGFGGTLPLVAEWLAQHDQLLVVVGYVTAAVAASAVGSWLLRYSLLLDDDA
jgi:MHS family alpha-ketoglutarate permease-like MFS transporter